MRSVDGVAGGKRENRELLSQFLKRELFLESGSSNPFEIVRGVDCL